MDLGRVSSTYEKVSPMRVCQQTTFIRRVQCALQPVGRLKTKVSHGRIASLVKDGVILDDASIRTRQVELNFYNSRATEEDDVFCKSFC